MEEAPASEPLERARGVDVIEGPAQELTGFYDTTIRLEWLERDLVKLLGRITTSALVVFGTTARSITYRVE